MADASPKFHPPDLLPPTAAAAADLSTAHDGLAFWQYMAAGSVAGLVEHTAMFPIDTLKTRIQTHSLPCHRPPTLRHAFRSLIRADGFLGLYRGISAMGLGAGPAHAAYFSIYEISKRLFLTEEHPNNPAAHATAGVVATVASDAVFTPMDTVKQRLQMGSSPYKGVVDCVRRGLKEEGLRAFYASYRTTVLMNAPFTAVHFSTYEAAKRGLVEISDVKSDEERLVLHATAGAAAGALASAVTTPLDVVKTQLQCQGVCGCEKFSSSSITEVIQVIIKRDGYAGLLRGLKPRMLFHAPAAAICWSTYEASKNFFKNLNDRNT